MKILLTNDILLSNTREGTTIGGFFMTNEKEIVLCIALILGFLGILICRPDFDTIKSSIDFRVLSLLFCLMYVIQGFSSINLLDKLAGKMLAKKKNTREMFFVLTFLVFFLFLNRISKFSYFLPHFIIMSI